MKNLFFAILLFSLIGCNNSAVKSSGKNESLTSLIREFESQLEKDIEAIASIAEKFEIIVLKELTKMFEETRRGTAEELFQHFSAHPPKGEIVVCVAGKE